MLQLVIAELRQRYTQHRTGGHRPFDPEIEVPGLRFTISSAGRQEAAAGASERNALLHAADKQQEQFFTDPEGPPSVLQQLQEDLRLSELPRHIECFRTTAIRRHRPRERLRCSGDAAQPQGDYRHFNIRTVEGPDDFASMEEAVNVVAAVWSPKVRSRPSRRDRWRKRPSLRSVKALNRLAGRGKTPRWCIAKKLDEPHSDDPVSPHIDKRSSSSKAIQHSAQRGASVRHHPSSRAPQQRVVRTALEDIPASGQATAPANS